MTFEIRRITLAELADVVAVMNGSSLGHSFEFRLDIAQFLSLSRLWNFSYDHSYIGFVDGQAAGVVLNSVDRESREAYSFYWGMLPQFRGHRMAMKLAFKFLDQVRDEGFLRAYADASPDSPHSIYQRLGFERFLELVELRTDRPVTQATAGWSVRELSAEEWMESGLPESASAKYWTRTPGFILNAGRVVEIFAAFRDRGPEAGLIVTRWPGYSVIWDCRLSEGSTAAAGALIQHLLDNDYPAPFLACYLSPGSVEHRFFREAGFASERRFQAMVLDLSNWHRRHP